MCWIGVELVSTVRGQFGVIAVMTVLRTKVARSAQQRVEAMHRQPIGQARDLLGDSGLRALRGRHHARSHRLGLLVGVVEQHWRQALTHVPFEVVGQHAEEDMRPDPIG